MTLHIKTDCTQLKIPLLLTQSLTHRRSPLQFDATGSLNLLKPTGHAMHS